MFTTLKGLATDAATLLDVGAQLNGLDVTDKPMNYVKYQTGGYTYHCQSVGGSALTDAVWQVARVNDSTGSTTYASGASSGYGSFAYAATSAVVVAALTYNLGVAGV